MPVLSQCFPADTCGDAYTVVGFLPSEGLSTIVDERGDGVDGGAGEGRRVNSSFFGSSTTVENLLLREVEREVCADVLRLAGSVISCLAAFAVKSRLPIQARVGITAGRAVAGLQVVPHCSQSDSAFAHCAPSPSIAGVPSPPPPHPLLFIALILSSHASLFLQRRKPVSMHSETALVYIVY